MVFPHQLFWHLLSVGSLGSYKLKHSVPQNFLQTQRNMGSVPGLGRSPGGRHDSPLRYSCWRIPWAEKPSGLLSSSAKSRTWLSDFLRMHTFQICHLIFATFSWNLRHFALKHKVYHSNIFKGLGIYIRVTQAGLKFFSKIQKGLCFADFLKYFSNSFALVSLFKACQEALL